MEHLDYEELGRWCASYINYYDAELGYKKVSRYKITPQAERIKREGLAVIQRVKDEVDFDNPFRGDPISCEVFDGLARVYNRLIEVITENRVISRRKRV